MTHIIHRLGSPALAALALASLSACAGKKPVELPPAPAEVATPAEAAQPAGPVPGSQEDFLAKVAADRVFFDTDKFNIDAEDAATLQSQAQWLMAYPSVRVVIEGHCDERGTRDYNLALGERRANAAKNYLASLGIDPARITTISYGKERPVALGSDEQAWAQNRRAVSVTIR